MWHDSLLFQTCYRDLLLLHMRLRSLLPEEVSDSTHGEHGSVPQLHVQQDNNAIAERHDKDVPSMSLEWGSEVLM